jgi:hypothetical protein
MVNTSPTWSVVAEADSSIIAVWVSQRSGVGVSGGGKGGGVGLAGIGVGVAGGGRGVEVEGSGIGVGTKVGGGGVAVSVPRWR